MDEDETRMLNDIVVDPDKLVEAIVRHPHIVLDTIREMSDHYGDVMTTIRDTPLGTPEGIARVSALQGKAQALNLVIADLVSRLTEAANAAEPKEETI